MTEPPVPLETVRESHRRLLDRTSGLTEDEVRAPSLLPDWTRAHVLAHLANNARGFSRMTLAALDGRVVPMYDGGAEGRNADIEAVAAQPVSALLDGLAQSIRDLEDSWEKVGADATDGWARPVAYRESALGATVEARWRESEIHAVDLDLGLDCSAWSADFCAHSVAFLLERVPVGSNATFVPSDDPSRWVMGDGSGPCVQGRLCDLTAWLAGRTPAQPVTSEGGEAPPLGPWPAR